VRLDREYVFGTDDGEKRLAELFDGRSQLLSRGEQRARRRRDEPMKKKEWLESLFAQQRPRTKQQLARRTSERRDR
jgi:hypothetical protein